MWATVVPSIAVAVVLGLPFILHVLFECHAFTRQHERWHIDSKETLK